MIPARIRARAIASIILAALMLLPAGLAPASAEMHLSVQGGSAVPNVVYLPIYVADQAGFFKEEGLDVELRYTNGGALATQLVANGNADIGHIVWQPALQAYAQGARGKFFYQTYTRSSFFLATLPDSPIKGPADLAGKTIGVINVASPGVFLAKSTARAGGVSPDTITFLPVGVGAQALAALEAGNVDALALWDAEYANYEAAGVKLNYIHHPKLGQVGNGGFYASETALAEKADALAAFSRAIAKGTAFLLANPEKALEMYWTVAPSAKPPGSEEEALRKGLIAVKFVSHSFDIQHRPDKRFGAIDPANVQVFIDALHDEGEIKETIPAAEIVDTRFIDHANDFDAAAVAKSAAN